MKKIRNNVLKSGLKPHHKRHIEIHEYPIQWQQWIDAYTWDITNHSLPIHRKLTNQHIYPTTKEKMRNHLAEQVLDSDMLHLMEASLSSTIQLVIHNN